MNIGALAVAFSVVIPVYNEVENLEALTEELRRVLGRQPPAEILLVDDGSTDDIVTRFVDLQRRDGAPVRLVRHARNRGQSAAIVSGVTAASGTIIVTMDGDGQNDPADLPRLLDIYRQEFPAGVRLVAGQRERRRDSLLRRVSSVVANRVRSRVLGDGIADTGCGLKVFDRETFLGIPPFDHMHRFLPALFMSRGARVLAVPVTHRPRLHGISKYGVGNRLWVGIVDLFGVRWLTRRRIETSDIFEGPL
ncbi:glycosyltransferase family 2 protein [soil metagenome]